MGTVLGFDDVGTTLGFEVGPDDGNDDVGIGLGLNVGPDDGDDDVGITLGIREGFMVGTYDGNDDVGTVELGVDVGEVGDAVGKEVGFAEDPVMTMLSIKHVTSSDVAYAF